MEQRRISLTDILVGEPLPWDIYDGTNTLLLRKGYVVERLQQIETLVQRGLFVMAAAGAHEKRESASSEQERPSAVRLINLANKRLTRLLLSFETDPQAEKQTLDVVNLLEAAMSVNADIALGCILLNQDIATYATRHCIDTAIVALVLARALQKTPEQQQMIVAAALTMNIGMLRQQGDLQNKDKPLSAAEQQVIHDHAGQSVSMLRQAGIVHPEWLSSVAAHHENDDGTGYPKNSSAAGIPENAKILALADRYCARISPRKYRKPMLPNAAFRDMLAVGKNSVDSGLVTRLIHQIGIYPVGTFVRLINGEIGVVTGKGANSTTPIVNSLIGPRGAPLAFPIKRETVKSTYAIRDVLSKEQAAIRVSMQQVWGIEAAL